MQSKEWKTRLLNGDEKGWGGRWVLKSTEEQKGNPLHTANSLALCWLLSPAFCVGAHTPARTHTLPTPHLSLICLPSIQGRDLVSSLPSFISFYESALTVFSLLCFLVLHFSYSDSLAQEKLGIYRNTMHCEEIFTAHLPLYPPNPASKVHARKEERGREGK